MKRFCQNGKLNINLIPSGRTVELQNKSELVFYLSNWCIFFWRSTTSSSAFSARTWASFQDFIYTFCFPFYSLFMFQSSKFISRVVRELRSSLWEELWQKDKNWYCRWSYEPQFKGKVLNFGMDVKNLASLESPEKKSIFGNGKLTNLSVMQAFWIQVPKIWITWCQKLS